MARFLISILFFFAFTLEPSASEKRVALELVLAVDTSTSVDDSEFDLQRRGIADAFAHDDLIAVIEGMGSLGIAVTLIEWAGTDSQRTIVGWTHLTNRDSSLIFSNLVRTIPRALSGMTDIGSVLNLSVRELETNHYVGNRRVIDVSGDGSSSVGGTAEQRDRAILRGITINGLVIFNHDYDLGALAEIELIRHYSNEVVGGNGSFLMTAAGFEDFRSAILRKLIREILGTGTAGIAINAPSNHAIVQ